MQRAQLLLKKMVLVFRAFASSSPVAGSASLLTNFKTQEKDGVAYSPGASLVNEMYTTPAELAKRVRTRMIKSSISPESAAGCIITETHSLQNSIWHCVRCTELRCFRIHTLWENVGERGTDKPEKQF